VNGIIQIRLCLPNIESSSFFRRYFDKTRSFGKVLRNRKDDIGMEKTEEKKSDFYIAYPLCTEKIVSMQVFF